MEYCYFFFGIVWITGSQHMLRESYVKKRWYWLVKSCFLSQTPEPQKNGVLLEKFLLNVGTYEGRPKGLSYVKQNKVSYKSKFLSFFLSYTTFFLSFFLSHLSSSVLFSSWKLTLDKDNIWTGEEWQVSVWEGMREREGEGERGRERERERAGVVRWKDTKSERERTSVLARVYRRICVCEIERQEKMRKRERVERER